MTRTTTLLLAATTLLGFGACGVNELGTYRGAIEAVEVQTIIGADIELDVMDPAVVGDPELQTPADAAAAATESYIITGLAERMRRYVAPEDTARAFDEVFASDLARGNSWALVRTGETPDARVVATVDGYGVTVDSLGQAQVYFRMTVRAWFEAEGKLIYQTWESHAAPLLPQSYASAPAYYSDDPAALAAERAYNLLVLNDVGGRELSQLVANAARDAAAIAAREMVQDTWR